MKRLLPIIEKDNDSKAIKTWAQNYLMFGNYYLKDVDDPEEELKRME